MPIELRPYQQRGLADIRAAYAAGAKRVLYTMPCGAGKTVCFAALAAACRARSNSVTILAHREELLNQIRTALHAAGAHGVTVRSVWQRKHTAADLLVIDEAHHAAANTWKRVLALPHRWVLGVTATPCRLDGRGLASLFDVLVQGPSVTELTQSGYLSPYRALAPPAQIDMAGVRRKMGEFDRHATEQRARTITGDVWQHWQTHAAGMRTIAFCASVAHSREVAEMFNAHGVPAATLHGDLAPDVRRRMVSDFRAGRLVVLTSCELVSEGFDLPAIEAALLLRPTASLSLHLQQIGRALRPGKPCAIILDHAGNCHRHGLPDEPREWSLTQDRIKRDAVAPVRTCKKCYAIFTGASCPLCAWQGDPVDAKPVRVVKGELIELKRVMRREVGKARTREDLERIARERGYKMGWVYNMLRLRGEA